MIFDEHGLPRDTGATDWMDSARLAGMMKLFDHPQAPRIGYYFRLPGSMPVRYPYGSGLEMAATDFSRDQAVPLIAASALVCFARNFYRSIKWCRLISGDFCSPSVMNHFRMCAGLPGTWLGFQMLKVDIWYNAKYTPTREPNQLIALCMVAGPQWVKRYKASVDWKTALRLYWSGWRGEAEFAEFLITKLEAI